MTAVYVLLGVLGLGGFWYGSVRLYPWRTCPRCHGDRRIGSGGVHRDCARCEAKGRVRRWGAPGGGN